MSEIELKYEPAPHSKDEIKAFNFLLEGITGSNPAGTGGFLKVGWGMDEKRFFGGFEDTFVPDTFGKYTGTPYYLMLAWSPPEVYDRAEWNRLRFDGGSDVLGEYPRTGVWDLFKILRREDMSPMMLDGEVLGIARNWRHHSMRPHASQRAIEDYIEYQEKKQEMKAQAREEYNLNVLSELEREFAKPETETAFSFSESVREAGINDVPSGFTRHDSGLIVPQSSIQSLKGEH